MIYDPLELQMLPRAVSEISKTSSPVVFQLLQLTNGRIRTDIKLVTYLVSVVHKVHGDAEGQGMVVGVSQKDGDDLHA